jgi:hypothetical protein
MKAEDLLAIGDLFDALGWPKEVAPDSEFPHLFHKFCRMCTRLDPDQRALVLELTRQYLWVPTAMMSAPFLAAWRNMVPQLPANIQTVAVVPLLKPGSSQPALSRCFAAIDTREYPYAFTQLGS